MLLPAPTQVNAKGLLREVHAAEEGWGGGVVADGVEDWIHSFSTGQCRYWLQFSLQPTYKPPRFLSTMLVQIQLRPHFLCAF